MPEPNFLPAGRFCKAMKVPRSLKLLLCIITCIPALVLQQFLHSCFFHVHTHKPRHKPGLPTGGEVHMHVPNIFLAWKVTLSIFYLYVSAGWLSHCSSQPVVVDGVGVVDHWLHVSMFMQDGSHLCWFQWEQYHYTRKSSQSQEIHTCWKDVSPVLIF